MLLGLTAAAVATFSNTVAAQEASDLEARGLVRSSARVEVRTDLAVAVKTAPFGDGMRFKKGQKLIEFDCGRYRAELSSAKASASAAAIEFRSKRDLRRHGAAGDSEVQLARADAARANAEVKARKSKVRDCVVIAPFDGRVVTLNTRKHEMPTVSEPVIVVLDDSLLELELVVPSKWLIWLKSGQKFSFKVDETGGVQQAQVTRLGAEVDPVSQTIKAYGELLDSDGRVLAGMSGSAKFREGGS